MLLCGKMTFMVLLDSYMLVLLHSLILRVVVGHLISPRRLEWCVIFFFFCNIVIAAL